MLVKLYTTKAQYLRDMYNAGVFLSGTFHKAVTWMDEVNLYPDNTKVALRGGEPLLYTAKHQGKPWQGIHLNCSTIHAGLDDGNKLIERYLRENGIDENCNFSLADCGTRGSFVQPFINRHKKFPQMMNLVGDEKHFKLCSERAPSKFRDFTAENRTYDRLGKRFGFFKSLDREIFATFMYYDLFDKVPKRHKKPYAHEFTKKRGKVAPNLKSTCGLERESHEAFYSGVNHGISIITMGGG